MNGIHLCVDSLTCVVIIVLAIGVCFLVCTKNVLLLCTSLQFISLDYDSYTLIEMCTVSVLHKNSRLVVCDKKFLIQEVSVHLLLLLLLLLTSYTNNH